jgi:hypothetical protein
MNPGGITLRGIFNLFWLGPNGSRLFLYKPNDFQGGDSNDLYND